MEDTLKRALAHSAFWLEMKKECERAHIHDVNATDDCVPISAGSQEDGYSYLDRSLVLSARWLCMNKDCEYAETRYHEEVQGTCPPIYGTLCHEQRVGVDAPLCDTSDTFHSMGEEGLVQATYKHAFKDDNNSAYYEVDLHSDCGGSFEDNIQEETTELITDQSESIHSSVSIAVSEMCQKDVAPSRENDVETEGNIQISNSDGIVIMTNYGPNEETVNSQLLAEENINCVMLMTAKPGREVLHVSVQTDETITRTSHTGMQTLAPSSTNGESQTTLITTSNKCVHTSPDTQSTGAQTEFPALFSDYGCQTNLSIPMNQNEDCDVDKVRLTCIPCGLSTEDMAKWIEESSGKLAAEQLASLLQTENIQLADSLRNEQMKTFSLQDSLSEARASSQHNDRMHENYRQKCDQLEANLASHKAMVIELEEQLEEATKIKSGLDYMIDARFAQSKAAQSEAKLLASENELTFHKAECASLREMLQQAIQEKKEMITLDMHHKLLQVSDEHGRLAEERIRQLHSQITALQSQLKEAEKPSNNIPTVQSSLPVGFGIPVAPGLPGQSELPAGNGLPSDLPDPYSLDVNADIHGTKPRGIPPSVKTYQLSTGDDWSSSSSDEDPIITNDRPLPPVTSHPSSSNQMSAAHIEATHKDAPPPALPRPKPPLRPKPVVLKKTLVAKKPLLAPKPIKIQQEAPASWDQVPHASTLKLTKKPKGPTGRRLPKKVLNKQ